MITDDPEVVISFFVPGIPRPGGSKKYMGHRKGKAVLEGFVPKDVLDMAAEDPKAEAATVTDG